MARIFANRSVFYSSTTYTCTRQRTKKKTRASKLYYICMYERVVLFFREKRTIAEFSLVGKCEIKKKKNILATNEGNIWNVNLNKHNSCRKSFANIVCWLCIISSLFKRFSYNGVWDGNNLVKGIIKTFCSINKSYDFRTRSTAVCGLSL